jgi:histone acetyltransferase (RNA polymerase elongator complex component)
MRGHANIPIFVPHGGCRERCSFCNQRAASGQAAAPTPADVRDILEKAMGSLGEKARSAQIAFFGGSFTALPEEERRPLLAVAKSYVDAGAFAGIRVSTRPDCVEESILDELLAAGVVAVELGAQSMDDAVLAANHRGHTAAQVTDAAARIKRRGLELGLHMMTGLYRATPASDKATALALADLKPDTMRIHPTLVLRDTMLARLYEAGHYAPESLDSAVESCVELLAIFLERDIPVIRLGLHDEPSLAENLIAGPYHPAFRELVEGNILLRKALAAIKAAGISPGNLILQVHPRCLSVMAGQNRRNLAALAERGFKARVRPDESLPPLEVRVLYSS